MLKFLKKLNPFNWLESFFIKRIGKKIIKAFPSLREKGLKIIEENKEEILQKIKVTVFEYLEEHKNN